jgi:hypothetical protein
MPEYLMAFYWEIEVTDKSNRGNSGSEDFVEKAWHCKLAIKTLKCASHKHIDILRLLGAIHAKR